MPADADIEQIRSDFVEKIGIVAQGEGMPRIAGRVFALLIFDGEAISFGDLATRLKVSRASVSSSVRLLETFGVIRRVAKAGERQDSFQLAKAPYATLLAGARQRTTFAKAEIDATISEPPARDADRRKRLEEYAGFYQAIDDGLLNAFEKLTKPGR